MRLKSNILLESNQLPRELAQLYRTAEVVAGHGRQQHHELNIDFPYRSASDPLHKLNNTKEANFHTLTSTWFRRDPQSAAVGLGNAYRDANFGDATYQVISAQEAIDYVKQNKANIQNLRIIYKGKLIEYEMRNNGSIYAIIASPELIGRSIPVGELSETKSYKDIRYAPWRAVIEHADKIYKTNEYEKIDQANLATQAKRKPDVLVPITKDELNPDDQHLINPHTPATNYSFTQLPQIENPTAIPKENIATLATDLSKRENQGLARHATGVKLHRILSNIGSLTFNFKNPEYKDDVDVDVLTAKQSHGINLGQHSYTDLTDVIRTYVAYMIQKEQLFIQFSAARKALKNLDKNKDQFEPEYFELQQQKAQASYNSILSKYNKISADAKALHGYLYNLYYNRNTGLQNKLYDYLSKLETLSNELYSLKNQANKKIQSIITSSDVAKELNLNTDAAQQLLQKDNLQSTTNNSDYALFKELQAQKMFNFDNNDKSSRETRSLIEDNLVDLFKDLDSVNKLLNELENVKKQQTKRVDETDESIAELLDDNTTTADLKVLSADASTEQRADQLLTNISDIFQKFSNQTELIVKDFRDDLSKAQKALDNLDKYHRQKAVNQEKNQGKLDKDLDNIVKFAD